jgi:hypothetical protein
LAAISYDSMGQNEYDFGDNILSEVAAAQERLLTKIAH